MVTVTMNPAIDTSCSIANVAPEVKLHCSEPRCDPGGGGINVARAIHLLGGDVIAYWTCGGPLGLMLGQLLDQQGVQHQPVMIDGMTRENFVVLETSTNHQYRFGMPGPSLGSEEVKRCLAQVRSHDPAPLFLVLSGSLPPGAPDDLYFQFARQAPVSCKVVLDSSGEPLRQGLNAGVYLIKPNLRELGQLAGRPIEGDSDVESISHSLIQAGKTQVVVTSLSSGGAIVVTAERSERLRVPTVKFKSKVGAGDCTVAGIVLHLSRGHSIYDAVRFGMASGAAAVMNAGTSLCKKEDVERLYQEMC